MAKSESYDKKMAKEFTAQMEAMETQSASNDTKVTTFPAAEASPETASELAAEIAGMDMYAFLPEAAKARVNQTKVFLAPPGMKNADGTRAVVKLRKLSYDDIMRINNEYRKNEAVRNRKGRIEVTSTGKPAVTSEVDGGKMTDAMIAESIVFPDLSSRELMQKYGVFDETSLVRKIFNTPEDYNYMANLVIEFSGLNAQPEDDEDTETLLVQRAKN